ncbi:uncharacterized protein UDID_19341 [Ustilago sp. UG-2017a]|nr:uncharacterized protein UDID_19341 [Ustilago sp. UG-2017a]
MNSLGLILLLSTPSALSAAFAQDCPLKFSPVLPRNSDFNKACSADSASKSFCFHHVSGSLRSANFYIHDNRKYREATPIVKDGFLTDFALVDITSSYRVNYTEAGLGLIYEPSDRDNCFDLTLFMIDDRNTGWKYTAAVANGGKVLFETQTPRDVTVQVCDRHVDLWLEKE